MDIRLLIKPRKEVVMRTLEYLFGPDAAIFWPPVLVGLLVAIFCSVLSPLIVLKRLAFIGQGVSHAAFAGVGLAMVLGFGAGGTAAGLGDVRVTGLVALVCILAALGIAWLSEHRGERADTAIGIVLVSAMALGFVLMGAAGSIHPGGGSQVSVESVLFGSIMGAGKHDALVGLMVTVFALGWLWWMRRAVLFWAFDQNGALASGVRLGLAQTTLLVCISLAIVLTMRLAGVVLATALLVVPGAAALHLSTRFGRVMILSLLIGLLGVIGGLVISFERDVPAGPAIVLCMVGLYALARVIGRRNMTGSKE